MTERRKRFYINGVMLAIVGLAGRSVALFFNSYISRVIGAEGMGLFGLISTVYSFAVTFATSGISLTVTKLTSQAIGEGREGELSRILRAALFYVLLFSTVASAALFLGAPYFAAAILKDSRAAPSLRVLAFSLIPLAVSSALSGYFVGVRRISKNAIISILGQGARILITVLLLSRASGVSAEHGAYIISLVMTITELIVLVLSVIQYLTERHTRDMSREKHLPAVCHMALPLALSAYIRSAFLTLEHALIPQKLRERGNSHEESLAAYGTLHGMALPLLLYPMSPLSSFAGLLVPEFSESLAKGEKERLTRIASEALNTTLKYSVVVLALIALFSEELGYAVYGSYEAGAYIAFLAPVIPLMYLDHVTDSILKGIGEQVYSMWVNITDSFLSVILVVILIPRMGIIGYALVILIMEMYNFLLSIIRLYRRIPFKINPFSSLIRPLISSIAAALLTRALFVSASSNTAPVWLFLEVIFAICIFVAADNILKRLSTAR